MTPPTPPQGPSGSRQTFSILAFACAAAALTLSPLLFGALGVVLGVQGDRRGEPLGRRAALTAGAATLVGFAVSAYLHYR